MKNKIYYILFIFFCLSTLSVGQICPPDDVLTDPDITGGWDWRSNPIMVFEHVQATGVNQIVPFPNPFFNFTNLNTGFLVKEGPAPLFQDLRDYQPSDGWELIYKQVGDEETPGRGVTHPVFVLYNKFQGILRIFISISDKDADYNGALITLEILNDQNSTSLVGNANLSLAGPIAQPLDAFTTDQSMVKINRWEEQDDYWLFAEFPVGYDPCVCLYESQFLISANLMRRGDLEWVSGGKKPETKKIVTNGKDDNNLEETYETISKFSKGVSKAATTGKTSAGKAVKGIEKVLELLDSQNNSEEDSKVSEIKEATKKASFKAPEWLKAIPKIGAVIGVIDFLVTGTDDKKTATVGSQMIETKGSIDFDFPFKSVKPIAPGAQKGTATQYLIPEYNNPLGVFTLFETPQLEYVEYVPDVQEVRYIDNTGRLHQTIQLPAIREYAVLKDLKYTVNPHAEVEIVNMDVSLVYIPKVEKISIPCDNDTTIVTPLNSSIYGPVEIGKIDDSLSYENRLFLQDINLNYGPTTLKESIKDAIYSTPAQSKDCFRYTRFNVFHWDNLGETDIKCKITLTLKAKNSDEEFMMIHTYPVQTQVSTHNLFEQVDYIVDPYTGNITTESTYRKRKYFFETLKKHEDNDYAQIIRGLGNCQTNFFIKEMDESPFSQTNYQIPSNLVIENQHFTTDETLKAWNSIIIGENVTVDPGVNIIVNAGNSVEFLEDANVDFNFETIISRPGSCPVINEVSEEDLNEFCKSDKYKELSKLKEQIVNNEIEEETKIVLKTYPVPFSNNMTIEFELDRPTTLSLVISNVLGQEVNRIIDNTNVDSGKHKFEYDGTSLATGIYFVTIQGENFNQTVKIIKE